MQTGQRWPGLSLRFPVAQLIYQIDLALKAESNDIDQPIEKDS
jgi:hypothetical protein